MSTDYLNINKIEIVLKEDLINAKNFKHLVHYHNAYEIMFLIKSENKLFIKDSSYLMQPRQIIFIAPYTVHRIEYNNNTEYIRYVLNFESSYLMPMLDVLGGQSLINMLNNLEISVADLDTHSFNKACVIFSNLEKQYTSFEKNPNLENNMRLKLALCSSIIDIHKIFTTQKANETNIVTVNLVKHVIEYLNENYMNPITLDDIEKNFYVSKYHLCHMFREVTGASVVEFLQYIRIAEAQKLLAVKKLPILEVCYQCGFNNIQHFYRVFKKVTGTTPKATQVKKS